MADLPIDHAVDAVVPDPTNGSKTIAGTGSLSRCSHDGSQPRVLLLLCPLIEPSHPLPPIGSPPAMCGRRSVSCMMNSVSTTLAHGAPHVSHTPCPEVLAATHRLTSSVG